MLDDAEWPATSARLDEACGSVGNALLIGEGSENGIRPSFVGGFQRGQRRIGMEVEYLEHYHSIDEQVPRFRRCPFRSLVRTAELFSPEELKTSPTYNDFFAKIRHQAGLKARLRGPAGCSHVAWVLGDPATSSDWSSAQVAMVERLIPHVEQFVLVRQMFVGAGLLNATLASLLDARRFGVVHLDRQGRIVMLNDRARKIVLRGDVLRDRQGSLSARLMADQPRLQSVLAGALPTSGEPAVGGWTTLGDSASQPGLLVHVTPTAEPQLDFVGHRVAALVLIVEPGCHPRVDPVVVAKSLGLTAAESRVAAWLAEGRTVAEIAAAVGCRQQSVHWHLHRIYAKQGITRQVELVRRVLSLAGFG